MKIKILIIGSLILFTLVLGIALYPENLTPGSETKEDVSWEEAIAILRSGDVAQVTQLHDLTVTLILEDGSHIVTTEPAIDVIWDEIRKCGKPCEDMIMATE